MSTAIPLGKFRNLVTTTVLFVSKNKLDSKLLWLRVQLLKLRSLFLLRETELRKHLLMR